MPGIVVFGRRWAVGSDDFVFPAAAEIVLRTAWFLALAIVLGVHNDDLSKCSNGHLLKIYYIGMVIILPLAMILSSMIMYFSMQGTITNDGPRQQIPSLILCKLFVFLIEIIWTALGTKWAFSEHVVDCSHTVVSVVKGATIVGWILLVFLLVGIVIVFDPLGSTMLETQAQLQGLWKYRCKLLCCCLGTNVDKEFNTYEDVAHIISEHLQGVNFVMTDVACAMILVQRQQEREHRERQCSGNVVCRVSYLSASSDFTLLGSDLHPKNWMSTTLASKYMKYALASYGWPFFVYDNHICGPFKLWCKCRCCLCLRPADNIFGDNCCGCNTSAILEQTLIDRNDIFYADYHNQLYEIPFYIIVDHETKSVVVSVRGTLSFEDVLTDMSADVEEVSLEGVEEAKAHKGIFKAATYVMKTLVNKGLLDDAFTRAPDYDLVIVGHSLGAGAAAILAILLKQKYSNVKCFAYSPPGGLVSLPLSRYAAEFVCSVVVGKDLVPRIGHPTIQKLKEKMISVVRQSSKPKYKILAGSAWRTVFCCWNNIGGESFDEESGERIDIEGSSNEPLLISASRRSYTEEQASTRDHESTSLVQYPLFMPGIVLFLEETEPERGCCDTPVYAAFWMKPESFDEILVSGMTMLHDHMPNVVYKALCSLSNDSMSPTNFMV